MRDKYTNDLMVEPAPENATSFRAFHNEFRKYRRRVLVLKEEPPRTGYVRPKTELELKFPGKKGRRKLKRMKQQARAEAGHFKGDNRPTITALAER